jgi:hypothetical protein
MLENNFCCVWIADLSNCVNYKLIQIRGACTDYIIIYIKNINKQKKIKKLAIVYGILIFYNNLTWNVLGDKKIWFVNRST